MARRALLVCGILASLLYAAMNIFIPMQWQGYSLASRVVSELSAIGAPTRSLWVSLGMVYILLTVAFGCGVWQSAGRNRALRILGAVIVAQGVAGLFWTPMHQREVLAAGGGTFTDTMHVVMTMVTLLTMMLIMGFGAMALGRRFRIYTIATTVVFVVFGFLTFLDAPKMEANLATPWIGVWERINIAAFMLWIAVLAVAVLRLPRERTVEGPATVIDFIRRHAVLTYFALVFAISWGGLLLLAGGPGAMPAPSAEVERLLPIGVLVMVLGPSLAGILMTGLLGGRAGLRNLWGRLTTWRAGARWYAIALLAGPLVMVASLAALSLVSPAYLPGVITSDDWPTIVMIGIGYGLIAGLFEELGWTGFAIPGLLKRHAAMTTGLIVGVIWGVWHFLTNFWGSGTASGALSLDLFVPATLFAVLALPAYRILMVWVYERSGSLPVAMIMHGSFTGIWLIVMPEGISGMPFLIWYLVVAAALWSIVGVVAVAKHGQMSPRSQPRLA